MSILNRMLTMGIENYLPGGELDPEVNPGTLEHDVPNADSFTESLLEVNEAQQNVEQHEDAIERGFEATEGLEAYANMMAASLGSRGLDPATANAVGYGVKREFSRIGVNHVSVGAEAFSNSATRISVTRTGLEDLREKLKSVWQWLLDLLEKAISAGEDFYLRVFGAAANMSKRADGIRSKAQNPSGAKKENKVDVSTNMVKALNIGKKIPTGIPGHLGNMQKIAGDVFTNYSKKASEFAEELIDKLADVDFDDDAKFTASVAAINLSKPFPLLSEVQPNPRFANDKRFSGNNIKYEFSEVLLGNYMVVQRSAIGASGVPSLDRDGANAIAQTRATLVTVHDKEPDYTSGTYDTMTLEDIISSCNVIEDIAALLDKFRRGARAAADLKKKTVKQTKVIKSKADKAKELDAANTTAAGQLVKIMGAIPTIVDQPNQKFSSYMLVTCKAVMDLCELSLAQYKN